MTLLCIALIAFLLGVLCGVGLEGFVARMEAREAEDLRRQAEKHAIDRRWGTELRRSDVIFQNIERLH